MKNSWQAPLTTLVVVILFAAFNAKPMQSAADIASWVQGGGSLLAIIAAVWIYAKQYSDKKADEENETRAFVQAIRDEVRALSGLYERQIGPALRNLAADQEFPYFYPVSADALTIYNSASSRVGKIGDPELRRLIVESYALVKGIISSYQMNNQLLTDYQSLLLTYRQDDREQVLGVRARGLVAYAADLKKQDERLAVSVAALLSHIDTWLRSRR